jgi:hypothetical protein
MSATGWRDQYDRMNRSLFRLLMTQAGLFPSSTVPPDDGTGTLTFAPADHRDALDALMHAYQDAYHLKDWIRNDPSITTSNVEQFINSDVHLKICADLCNGSKHFQLDERARTGDPTTAVAAQHVKVLVGRNSHWYSWTVSSNGVDYEANDLLAGVVQSWTLWLRAEGLLEEVETGPDADGDGVLCAE